ncbi:DNA polymerase delta subunit 4, putative [Talaromyces stipitatus ATCC 10500]|uniref:DNA polymerase delta subunit 4, putative n=1 Tax=Talaromyces stipitatus (strain ATCC 10500 / CBS 375.48 / QM 6759 / NRRL 1006) TaxID=441959 RepID=B8MQ77_TALSN|nr:DNA polymerase delta subunit 4, putative [Talaromyces stipitatus ATCC 10500]EED13146.1 DNA polymerase delta subunit 4, putative [Talaromyces stipitatus ATCC 10500]
MPPRRSTGRTASGQQSKLSFGTQSRVTKPSTTAPGKQIKNIDPTIDQEITKKASSPSPSASPATPDTAFPEQVPVTSSTASSKPHVAELAIREQAKEELSQPQTEEDRRALKISEAQIRKYWNEEEHSRKAPRVHQNDIDIDEKILRHFDLSSQYGPCVGISRIKRWRRAHMLDLNPPIEVLAVLLKDRKTPVTQRAYVDELLS